MRRLVVILLCMISTLPVVAQPAGILPIRARITPANAPDVSLYMLLARRADRLLWSPGGSLLAVVDSTDIDLYAVSDWLATPLRIRIDQPLTDFAFSPDGSVLYTLAGGAVVAWSTEDASITQRYIADARRMSVSPDGATLALLDRQNLIQIVDVGSRSVYTITPGIRPDDLAFGSNGRVLVTDGMGGGEILDVPLRRTERVLAESEAATTVGLLASAAYSGDGRRVFSQTADQTDAIRIYNPRTGEASGALVRPAEYQRVYGWGLNTRSGIAVGAAIGMAPEQSAVLVWPLTGGDPLARLRHPGVRDAQPSPDGSLIASVGGGTLRLWAAGETLPTQAQVSALSQVNVVAACDVYNVRPSLGEVLAGQTISLVWSWYATTPRFVRDYADAAIFQVTLDGVVIRPWIFASGIAPDAVNDGYPTLYFYAPIGGLTRGQHRAAVAVTWVQPISDGFSDYGPGTASTSDGGTCDFAVR